MAQAISPAPAGEPGLQTLPYAADRVFPLRVPLGFQTTLVLDPNERIENIAVGDSESWEIAPNRRGDIIFIKPLRLGGVTNLTVVTDIRIYVFRLSAASAASAETPFSVRFQYPEAVRADAPSSSEAPPAPAAYRLSGSRPLQPGAVNDDGVRTYIEWRPDQVLPAVFALDERRREMLVDGQMRDGRYVIDAVYPVLVFRQDRQTARATRLRPGQRR